MTVEFACPACHRRLAVARRKSGAVVDCPVCAESQRVPEEIVISSTNVVRETPKQGRVIGTLIGLFAGWGALLVVGTVLYTSHTQALAQTEKSSELPAHAEYPKDCPGSTPAVEEQLPNFIHGANLGELAGGNLLAQRNVEALERDLLEPPALPVTPALPAKPAAPPTPTPPSRDDTSVVVNLPPPTLPYRSLEEQVLMLMTLPEMGTTANSRRVFLHVRPQAHLANMMAVHPEFATLPMQPLAQAQRQGEDALAMNALSKHMRNIMHEVTVSDPRDGSLVVDSGKLRTLMSMKGAYSGLRTDVVTQMVLQRRLRGDRMKPAAENQFRRVLLWTAAKELTQASEWIDPNAVATLLQILQAENAPVRYLLVEILDSIPGTRATAALAMRAIFDLDPVVREAAIIGLSKRPRHHYREILLMGLQYPWTPANENAAAALVKLRDRPISPYVLEMLETQRPRDVLPLPGNTNAALVREPVRIQHQSNCLMCHPGSVNLKDLVRIDIPKQANPTLVRDSNGLCAPSSSSSSLNSSNIPDLELSIRADITFLRPDFSVQLPVPRQLTKRPNRVNSSPLENYSRDRYDFTVRTRLATPQEQTLLSNEPYHPALYPNRSSLLYVLYHLDGPSYVRAVRKIKADMERNNYLPVTEEAPQGQGKEPPLPPGRDKDQAMKPGKDKPAPPVRKEEPPAQLPAMKEEENKELLRLRKP
jgi:hypothetical protein